MHPILARGGRLAIYGAVWILAGVLLGMLVAVLSPLGWRASMVVAVPLAVVYSFACLSAWYVARSMPPRRAPPGRVIATVALAAGVTSALWVAAARSWIAILAHRLDTVPATPLPASIAALVFALGILLYLLAIAAAYVTAAIELARDAERRALEGQVLAREAELRSLRAQVDPHFLFNSLNSIGALTLSSPADARHMCLLLADFLRDTLSLGAQARTPLARELAMAERYLSIEQVRFGDRLRVAIDAGEAGACQVPPLLLQPLIENAVTHGIAHRLEGGTVRVAARRSPAALTLSIENPCDPDRPRGTGTGVGLGNVRSRLNALYGSDAAIVFGEREGTWRVVITLPMPDAPAASHHD